MPFDSERDSRPYPYRPRRFEPQMRRPDPRFDTKVLQIDMSDDLLAEVRDIANERKVSLYRQIREFVQQGVREYREDKHLAERDEDYRRDVFKEGAWQP